MDPIQQKPFKYFDSMPAPEGLVADIIAAVRCENARRRRTRAVTFGIMSVGSLVIAVFAYTSVSHALSSTGFSHYLSLLFSDTSLVAAYWRELVLSILETVPILSVAAMLAAVFLFLWSLGNMMQSIRRTGSLKTA